MTQPSRFLSVLVLLIVRVFGPVGAAGQVVSSSTNLQPTETAQGKGVPRARVESEFPICPPPERRTVRPSPTGISHHKVVLSWTASAPSPGRASKDIRYCLYRSQTEGVAKLKPTCNECEQVNSVAFSGTRCVDDTAQDDVRYYYVAMAIIATGATSSASNEAPVQIPAANQTNPVFVSSTPPPSCQVESHVK
jgi:hypothetical protein